MTRLESQRAKIRAFGQEIVAESARSLELLRAIDDTLDWLKKLTSGFEADSVFALEGLERIHATSSTDEQIDPEGSLVILLEQAQDSLKGLDEILIHKRQRGRDDPRLTEDDGIEAAYCDAIAACAELRNAVDALRWALLEHDASAAEHLEGFVADTPEGVAAMLDRIPASS